MPARGRVSSHLPRVVNQPLVAHLLAYAAGHGGCSYRDSPDAWQLECVADREFQWAIDGGLGPLVYRATCDAAAHIPTKWHEALLSADLTARVRYGNLVDTMKEIVDVCNDAGTRVTLLKGISTSDQLYPAGHLRPMGDIDVLVPAHLCAAVESSLTSRGYREADAMGQQVMRQHHGPPLYHPGRHVWVEVHTALFPAGDELQRNALFSPSHITAESFPSTFQGRPVNRLTAEFQLVYIASSWMRDLIHVKVHPSCMASLFDSVYLLTAPGQRIDWERLLGSLDNEMAAASVYVTLTYLAHRGLLDPSPMSVASHLAKAQRLVGRVQARAIHLMLDRYLIGGRPWKLLLPPPVPGRYKLRYQWEKRISAPLRNRR